MYMRLMILVVVLAGSNVFADTFNCRELNLKGSTPVVVRKGLVMSVSYNQAVREGVPFPVNVRITKNGGPVFLGQVRGRLEDVMFNFSGVGTRGEKLSAIIYLDELDQTSVKLRFGQTQIEANFICQ